MPQEPVESGTLSRPASYEDLSRWERQQRLRELALLFLKLGTVAFGGPAVHIAMMNEEVVIRRRWLDRQAFLDLLGATNLIPGPNSTELAIHIGYARAGWRGLILAGSCFILPAMLIVWALAVIYARYRTIPEAGWLLYGIKPVIIAVVAQALWSLGRSAIKHVPAGVAAALVVGLSLLGVHEILLLLLAGLAVMTWTNRRRIRTGAGAAAVALAMPGFLAETATVMAGPYSPTLLRVFGFFLKIGSVLYGSGYVLLAFLQADLVNRWHWLNSQELLDAVAVGQFTPGPVFTTATFIGYLLAGSPGAILATLGIFLPSFVFVAAINPWVPKLRRSPWAAGFLDGVNAASLALMAVVTWTLARAALADALTVAMALLSLVAVFRYKVNSAWLVLAGGVIGILSRALL